MKKQKTNKVVVSFRVPSEVAAKIDKIADEIPRGSVSKVMQEIFIPAFDRYVKKHEQKAAAAMV